MHLKFGCFVLYTHQSIDKRKEINVFMCKTVMWNGMCENSLCAWAPRAKLSCGTVGAKIAYVLGLLVHGKLVVEFGRCNHSRKHNCDEVSK